MACCLTAPSHYLNQCWLIISEVQWHSYQGNFIRPLITKIRLKITFLKFHSNLSGANVNVTKPNQTKPKDNKTMSLFHVPSCWGKPSTHQPACLIIMVDVLAPNRWQAIVTPDSKVHGANMGPIWGRQDPDEPHVGSMNFAIWDSSVITRGVYIKMLTFCLEAKNLFIPWRHGCWWPGDTNS